MKIAVFITRRDYEVVYSLLRGIHERAQENDVDVIVFFCGEMNQINTPNAIGERKIFSLPQLTDYDGAIIVTQQILFTEVLEPIIDMILKSGIPAVSIGGQVEGISYVNIDNYAVMSKLAEHVLKVHHAKDILYVAGLKNYENEKRLYAITDVLQKYGVIFGEDKIISEKYTYQDGFLLAEKIYQTFGKEGLPDAIFCDYDAVAYGIMDYFFYRTKDVKIPEDIVITGFHNNQDNKKHFCTLTTIQKSRKDMGYTACDMILQNDTRKKISKKSFDGTLILGKSCGCKQDWEIDYEGYIKENYIFNLRREYFQLFLEKMAQKLRTAKSNHEFIERLKEELPRTKADGFYMMLEDSLDQIDGSKNSGSDNTIPYVLEVPVIWKDNIFTSADEIKSKDFLPDYQETHGDLYVTFALHYQEHAKGYCVFKNPWYLLENDFMSLFARSLNTSLEICGQKIRLVKMNEKLNRLYVIDSLTGLLNRFGYEKEAGSLFLQNNMQNKMSIVAFVDLDRLKYINDTFGHEFGDIAILSVTGVIKKIFPKDYVKVRWGGDEFVLFGECQNQETAERYIQALKQEFATSIGWDVLPFDIDASIGYVLTDPKEARPLSDYIQEADQKMYTAKMKKKQLRKQKLGSLAEGMDERLL